MRSPASRLSTNSSHVVIAISVGTWLRKSAPTPTPIAAQSAAQARVDAMSGDKSKGLS